MFKVLFGNIANGRLNRLQYLSYCLLLTLLLMGLMFAIILAMGVGEHILGGNLQQAQVKLRAWFTLPFFIVFGSVILVFILAGMNIMAKRIRDIGLSGCWVILVIIVVEIIVSFAIDQQSASGLHSLIFILLLLIPANSFLQKGGGQITEQQLLLAY